MSTGEFVSLHMEVIRTAIRQYEEIPVILWPWAFILQLVILGIAMAPLWAPILLVCLCIWGPREQHEE